MCIIGVCAAFRQIRYRGSQGIGNAPVIFLIECRGYWQPSEKFLRGYLQILQIAHMATYKRAANPSNPWLEGIVMHQYRLAEDIG